jgi:hypothetical protein
MVLQGKSIENLAFMARLKNQGILKASKVLKDRCAHVVKQTKERRVTGIERLLLPRWEGPNLVYPFQLFRLPLRDFNQGFGKKSFQKIFTSYFLNNVKVAEGRETFFMGLEAGLRAIIQQGNINKGLEQMLNKMYK